MIYISIFIRIVSVTIAIGKIQTIDIYIETEIFLFNVGLFDFIGFCNCTHIVTNTFDHYSDYACFGKALFIFNNFLFASVELNSIISVFNKSSTVNHNINVGNVVLSIIGYVPKTICVTRVNRLSNDLIIVLKNIFNRIIRIGDFNAVVACINRSSFKSGGMIVYRRIGRIFHCFTCIIANHHVRVYCEIPVFVFVGYNSRQTIINLIIVATVFMESQCAAVAAVPMTLTMLIVLTVCRKLVIRILVSITFESGLVLSCHFEYPFMFMVGILKLTTYFSRMIIYYVIRLIEIRKRITLYYKLVFFTENGNELIPIQFTFGYRTIQKIGYFTGLKRTFRFRCSFAFCSASVKVVAGIYSAIVQANNSTNCVNGNRGRITENISHVITTLDRSHNGVFADNTTDIGNRAADCTGVIAYRYATCVEACYTADCIFAVNLTCIINLRYCAIVGTGNTTDVVIAFDCAVIRTINYCTSIVTNDTASILILTDNGSLVVTIFYRGTV